MAPNHKRKSSAAADSSKLRKLSKPSLANQQLVTIYLGEGPAQQQYDIHKNVILAHSVSFAEKLQSDETNCLFLYRWSSETFDTFLSWCYSKTGQGEVLQVDELDAVDNEFTGANENGGSSESGDMEGDGSEADDQQLAAIADTHMDVRQGAAGNSSPDGKQPIRGAVKDNEQSLEEDKSPAWYSVMNCKGRVFGRLLERYIFATRYEALGFRETMILKLQRCINEWETLPCPTILKRAWDELDAASPLCQYLVICYAYYADFSKERFATLSPGFLTEVLCLLYANDSFQSMPTIQEKWCDFHEHANDEEREKCEEGRAADHDPDVHRPPNA